MVIPIITTGRGMVTTITTIESMTSVMASGDCAVGL